MANTRGTTADTPPRAEMLRLRPLRERLEPDSPVCDEVLITPVPTTASELFRVLLGYSAGGGAGRQVTMTCPLVSSTASATIHLPPLRLSVSPIFGTFSLRVSSHAPSG